MASQRPRQPQAKAYPCRHATPKESDSDRFINLAKTPESKDLPVLNYDEDFFDSSWAAANHGRS